MAEDSSRAVFVTNISMAATEKTVSDFFSFCGRITKLTLRRLADMQEAVVVFDTDSASKTALLLTNALIVDRAIVVVPYVPAASASSSAADSIEADSIHAEAQQELSADEITQRNFAAPDSERTKTSVIASMLAAGYVLGTDAIGKAREYDDKHMISLQLKVGAEQVKAKANEIDKALHISETANVIKAVTIEKAKEVDEKLQISSKVTSAADAVKQQASALATKASENELVAKGFGLVKSFGTSITQSLQNLKDESLAIAEQKRREEGSTTTTTSTTTVTTETSAEVPLPTAPAAPSPIETEITPDSGVVPTSPLTL